MKSYFTINVKGQLLTTEKPLVMGILNTTPDSFFAESRVAAPDDLVSRAREILADGADILDVGACSTRPGSVPVTCEEELRRLHAALELLDKELPDAVVSIDTFRAQVVRECVEQHNVSIINDVSGFDSDNDMLDTVAELKLPYILTHSRGDASNRPQYDDFMPDVLKYLAEKTWQLRQRGVCDIIIDPGFGFGKTQEQNYYMMAHLKEFAMLDAPLLVGVSRKSMLTKLLGITAADALNATTALNTIAILSGADILRVHDVKAATEAIAVCSALFKQREY